MKTNNNNIQPPQRALRFLHWFCREDCLEEIEGDLVEMFFREHEGKPGRASRKFTWRILRYFRPAFIKSFRGQNQNNTDMYKSYFKIGWRHILRDKFYAFIKIGGLAIGVASCLLIAIYILDEFSYDEHYPDKERIYRVLGVLIEEDNVNKGVSFPAPMAEVLQAYPEIEAAGRYNDSELFGAGGSEVRAGEATDNAYDDGFVYFDQSLVDIFQPEFVYGNPSLALSNPNSVVITRNKAEKYFPGENPVGKTLVVNNNQEEPLTVGGVIENFPHTSHLQFDFLVTMTGREFWPGEQTFWGASNYAIYIRTGEGTNIPQLEKKLTYDMLENYMIPMMIDGGMPEKQARSFLDDGKAHIKLQPLTSIHLYSSDIHDGLVHGDIKMIWLFGGIALFILLIAIINFINLSTAKSANRAKEVGLRKVVGSMRRSLVRQFISESVLISTISILLGALVAWSLMGWFNAISGKSLSFPVLEWWLLPALLAGGLLTGFLGGIYPAFYLSAFAPVKVLKGEISRGKRRSRVRSSLVTFQFATSVVLIVSTLVVSRQMNYILNMKLGYDKEQVLLMQGTHTLGDQVVPFAEELRTLPGVVEVSTGDYLPVRGSKRNGNGFWNEGRTNLDAAVTSQFWRVDATYLETLGISLVEGRNFDRDLASDSSAIIINESMARALGGDMIGKQITNYAGLWTVIGVMEDFNFESLRENIQPLALVLGNETTILAVKLEPENISASMVAITKKWDTFVPNQSFRYTFLDQQYENMYRDVARTKKIFTSFSVLAIVIACLGLFALSAFLAEQRSKEIGIRKVLGASVAGVVTLLSKDFLVPVIISLILATPVAYYLMTGWLQGFAYKITLDGWMFILAGMLAVLIAVLTVSFQAIRAAVANPVTSLRKE